MQRVAECEWAIKLGNLQESDTSLAVGSRKGTICLGKNFLIFSFRLLSFIALDDIVSSVIPLAGLFPGIFTPLTGSGRKCLQQTRLVDTLNAT